MADANLSQALGRDADAALAMMTVKTYEGLLANSEKRPVRSDAELGLPGIPDHQFNMNDPKNGGGFDPRQASRITAIPERRS